MKSMRPSPFPANVALFCYAVPPPVVHVVFHLTRSDGDRETIERVHAVHKEGSPVYRSIHRAIDITTELRTA